MTVRVWRPLGMIVLSLLLGLFAAVAVFAPEVSPFDVLDPGQFSLTDSLLPPGGGSPVHWLGTDEQGRDLLSAIIHGLRSSLVVGLCATALAGSAGIAVGVVAGYSGRVLDAVLMRLADLQLTFPALLIALLVDGIVRAVLPGVMSGSVRQVTAAAVVVFAVGISRWPQFARVIRVSTMAERGRDYVAAARVVGVSGARIMLTHVLPNVAGPATVITTLTIGLAIVDEATLSFLGVGLPASEPSLGTLVRSGSAFLFSGDWWVAVFPGAALVVLVVSINLLGDWLRGALANPQMVDWAV